MNHDPLDVLPGCISWTKETCKKKTRKLNSKDQSTHLPLRAAYEHQHHPFLAQLVWIDSFSDSNSQLMDTHIDNEKAARTAHFSLLCGSQKLGTVRWINIEI